MAPESVSARQRIVSAFSDTPNDAADRATRAQYHPRRAFATRAHARLLDGLGWPLPADPRHEKTHHAPLQCCFVMRDGAHAQAAFGYTGLTLPEDADCPTLARARAHVETFLTRLGEDRALLIQNTPLFAFGGRRRDRIAVFGGWRVRQGTWAPFLLGPDGLGGVAGQDMLFARGTAPHHMAEVCGHVAKDVMPRIVDLVRAIDALEAGGTAADGPAAPATPVRIVAQGGGWFTARPGRAGGGTVSVLKQRKEAARPAADTPWPFGEDEFRFHDFGADRG